MGATAKSAIRYCQQCGTPLERKRFQSRLEDFGRFLMRRYCDQQCMAAAMEGVTKVANAKNGRRQATKTKGAACEACAKTGWLHVHHVDEVPTNNEPNNLVTLCPSCHKNIHSLLSMEKHSSRDQAILSLKERAARKCSKATATPSSPT